MFLLISVHNVHHLSIDNSNNKSTAYDQNLNKLMTLNCLSSNHLNHGMHVGYSSIVQLYSVIWTTSFTYAIKVRLNDVNIKPCIYFYKCKLNGFNVYVPPKFSKSTIFFIKAQEAMYTVFLWQ